MCVSNNSLLYPQQPLKLEYNTTGTPDTGVHQINAVPLTNNSFPTYIIALQGTEWIIVSKIELYHEDQTGTHLISRLGMSCIYGATINRLRKCH